MERIGNEICQYMKNIIQGIVRVSLFGFKLLKQEQSLKQVPRMI